MQNSFQKSPHFHTFNLNHVTVERKNICGRPGVGNCFGLRAASRSRKLAEGRTFYERIDILF